MFNMFNSSICSIVQYVPLSYSADIDDFAMTYGNFMNALEI